MISRLNLKAENFKSGKNPSNRITLYNSPYDCLQRRIIRFRIIPSKWIEILIEKCLYTKWTFGIHWEHCPRWRLAGDELEHFWIELQFHYSISVEFIHSLCCSQCEIGSRLVVYFILKIWLVSILNINPVL